jgi:hypothetical protein
MKLVDLRCSSCGTEYDDIWQDEVFKECIVCQNGTVVAHYKHAPMVDAKMPFYVESLGRTFTSHHAMDLFATKSGKVIEQVDGRKLQSRPTKSVAERIDAGQKKAGLREIIKKSAYRVKHGYQDHPKMTTESQLAKET